MKHNDSFSIQIGISFCHYVYLENVNWEKQVIKNRESDRGNLLVWLQLSINFFNYFIQLRADSLLPVSLSNAGSNS